MTSLVLSCNGNVSGASIGSNTADSGARLSGNSLQKKKLVAPRSTQRRFVSAVDQVERTIERFLGATRTFLGFAAAPKCRFRDNHEWVSKRLHYYVRVNFAVLELVVATRANQHPSRHDGTLRLLWFDAGVHNRTRTKVKTASTMKTVSRTSIYIAAVGTTLLSFWFQIRICFCT